MKKKSPKNQEKLDNIKREKEELLKEIENLKSKNLISSYLGNKGYSIYKISLTPSIINFIKKELTVKPFIQNSMIEPNEFSIVEVIDITLPNLSIIEI